MNQINKLKQIIFFSEYLMWINDWLLFFPEIM